MTEIDEEFDKVEELVKEVGKFLDDDQRRSLALPPHLQKLKRYSSSEGQNSGKNSQIESRPEKNRHSSGERSETSGEQSKLPQKRFSQTQKGSTGDFKEEMIQIRYSSDGSKGNLQQQLSFEENQPQQRVSSGEINASQIQDPKGQVRRSSGEVSSENERKNSVVIHEIEANSITEWLPPSFEILYTDDGEKYYHNTYTGETFWDLPERRPSPCKLN